MEHWIKVNTDGSLLGVDSNAACGGIARDQMGNFLAALSVNLGPCLVTSAELWAVFWAWF